MLSDFLDGTADSAEEPGHITLPNADQPVLLEVQGAWKTYEGSTVPAMSDVSLQLARGGTLGIVGGSGCGKTTLARAILGLHRLDRGSIRIGGKAVEGLAPEQLQHIRSNVGLVFQDPRAALNPTRKVGAAIREVLEKWGHSPNSADREARQLISSVGLEEDALERRARRFFRRTKAADCDRPRAGRQSHSCSFATRL